ncbi:Glycosyltransferase involved in cell wall bisynthesis [Novosphingobium sp. CF614]|uniref:glycosyltransferase family 4 protein n=1 Tax=Novosphingobium sp. CF614 TaxID=1884364 RepID=UPI0008DF671A|nr:glycosyltransferase family 4 protein [Novosphingobium sp. CF614]SFG20411.1 Glycosyltransferase involved in cell wall bisynthesis [Novosphingobium sp. CF614]
MKIVATVNAAWNLVNFRMGVLRALMAQGFEIVAVTPEDTAARPTLANAGIRLVALPMDSAGLSPVRDLALLAGYRRVLSRERPSAMLGYTIKPNVYGSIAARSLGIPTLNNISGLGTGFMRKGALNRIVRGLYRVGLAGAHTVFFQNNDDLLQFEALGLVHARQAVLLPGSGIDLTRFAAAPPADPARPLRFLLVARMLWDKGIGEYVEAARIVRREYPDVCFGLLGGIGAANRTAIPARTVEEWVGEGVVDHYPHVEDVRMPMADADVIVLPSYREGTSRVLLEASALARPMITTDVPGCRDVVEDGVAGLLCRAKDVSSLAEAMRRMIALTPAERHAMGQAARARVERDYAEQRVIDIYLERVTAAIGARR